VRVYVRLLGVYREYLPVNVRGSTYSLDVSSGARIEELLSLAPVPSEERQIVLINGRTPLEGQVLEEGDTIAILPAAAGG
jgi:molybdopterin converting factor small subunit